MAGLDSELRFPRIEQLRHSFADFRIGKVVLLAAVAFSNGISVAGEIYIQRFLGQAPTSIPDIVGYTSMALLTVATLWPQRKTK